MPYKDILVYADASKTMAARCDVAALMAREHNAHLAALHVVMPTHVFIDGAGGVPVALVDWQEKYAKEQADLAKQSVIEAARRTGYDIEWRLVRGEVDNIAKLHSLYADLVIVTQAANEVSDASPDDGLAEELVLGSGRPVLVVPRHGTFPSVGERVLVTWNRTRESARAIDAALPILARAKSVTVLEVNPAEGEEQHLTGTEIGTHLARHGISAEMTSIVTDEISVGDAILSRAAELGSDLLVMGAYGHSRFREYIFGGVTRNIIQHMTLPVLMAH